MRAVQSKRSRGAATAGVCVRAVPCTQQRAAGAQHEAPHRVWILFSHFTSRSSSSCSRQQQQQQHARTRNMITSSAPRATRRRTRLRRRAAAAHARARARAACMRVRGASGAPHLCVHDCLAVVGHEPDQRGVPLVGDLGERGAAAAHQHLQRERGRSTRAQEGRRHTRMRQGIVRARRSIAGRCLPARFVPGRCSNTQARFIAAAATCMHMHASCQAAALENNTRASQGFTHSSGSRSSRASHLAHAVLKRLERLVVDAQEGLRRALLGGRVLQRPHAVFAGEALGRHAHLGQDAHLRRGGGGAARGAGAGAGGRAGRGCKSAGVRGAGWRRAGVLRDALRVLAHVGQQAHVAKRPHTSAWWHLATRS